MTGLILCSHGTRSRVGAARIRGLVGAVAEALPSVDVREAHVDVHPPFLEDVITPGVVVVPLLLAPGHHVQVDIAGAASRVRAIVTPTLGPDDLLTSLLAIRLHQLAAGPDDVLVLAAAGSSQRGSDQTTRKVGHALSAQLRRPVHVGYGAACPPRLNHLVDGLRTTHPGSRILAASYLLAPGHFLDIVRDCGVDRATTALLDGERPDPRLVELVVRRYLGALPLIRKLAS